MTEAHKNLTLMKVLAATAWADGEISPEEETLLEHVAVDLDLTEQDKAEFLESLEHPVGYEEAEEMARDLLPSLTTEQREKWLDLLQKVISSDSKLDPNEITLLETIREAVKSAEEGSSLIGKIRGFFRSERASEGGAGRVLPQILSRMGSSDIQAKLDQEHLEHASLFGAILYRVAFADGEFSDDESARLRTLLIGAFDFEEDDADHVLNVIRSKAGEDLDRQRLCASFNRVSDMNARMKLLGCLFLIAEADGSIDDKELREMRLIANYLWIGAKEFHKIRMKHTAEGS